MRDKNMGNRSFRIHFTIMLLSGLPGAMIFGLTENMEVGGAVIVVDPLGLGDHCTINDALDAASPGDTIEVRPGTYDEHINISKTITIQGSGINSTIIDGQREGTVITVGADHVTITGVRVQNSGRQYDSFGIRVGSSHCEISDSNISGNYRSGLYLDSASFATIRSNQMWNNSWGGIWIENSDDCEIVDNMCQKSAEGISLDNCHSNVVRNNLCKNNTIVGISIYSSSHNTIEYNDCIGNCDYIPQGNAQKFGGMRIAISHSNHFYRNTLRSNCFSGIDMANCDANTFSYNEFKGRDDGLTMWWSTNISMDHNDFTWCGLYVYGDQLPHWNTHTIDCTNHVNGKYLVYWSDVQGGATPIDAGMILLSNCSEIHISSLHITQSTVAVQAAFSTGIDVVDSTMNWCRYNGISLYRCDDVKVDNCWIEGCGYGVSGTLLGNSTIERNAITDSQLGVDLGDSANNRIFDNDINLNGGGVNLRNCRLIRIKNNDVSHNTGYALCFYWCRENLVDSNTMGENLAGTYLYCSANNTISANICESNGMSGINVYKSPNSIIAGNICGSNGQLHQSYGRAGISVYMSNRSTIIHNNCTGNDEGIMLYKTASATVTCNVITENDMVGLHSVESCSNLIHHNLLVMNDPQVLETGSNIWDDGMGQGNHWSDYQGLDNGAGGRPFGDGIGDTEIPHLGLDKFPLIYVWDWLYPETPRLLDPGDTDTDGWYNITWAPTARTTGYILEQSGTSTFDAPLRIYNGSSTSHEVQGRANGTYHYRVKAYNEYFTSSWSNVVNINVHHIPSPPENLSVSIDSRGNILKISWEPGDVNASAYYLHCRTDDSWEPLAMLYHPTHMFNHTGLLDGERYFYRVQTVDPGGYLSGFSAEASGVPMDSTPPSPPPWVNVMESGAHSLTIVWSESPEGDVAGYNIYRMIKTSTGGWGPPINDAPATELEYVDGGLSPDTTYRYVITALDEVPNESSFSDIANGTTVIKNGPPTVAQGQPDVHMYEDTVDTTAINLQSWFGDPDGDPLEFRCEGYAHINVTICQDTGKVALAPEMDWNGEERLTFYASDGSLEVWDTVRVVVEYVNDPPRSLQILPPLDGVRVIEGLALNFTARFEDPDIYYGDMFSYNWSSDKMGALAKEEELRYYHLPPGQHTISLTVTDSGGAMCNATMTLTVVDRERHNDNEISGDQNNQGGQSFLAWMIILTIMLVFATASTALMHRRWSRDLRPETATPILNAEIEHGFQWPNEDGPPPQRPMGAVKDSRSENGGKSG